MVHTQEVVDRTMAAMLEHSVYTPAFNVALLHNDCAVSFENRLTLGLSCWVGLSMNAESCFAMQETLDPALTRPGRFDRRVAVPMPDVRGRLDILQHYLKVPKLTFRTTS